MLFFGVEDDQRARRKRVLLAFLILTLAVGAAGSLSSGATDWNAAAAAAMGLPLWLAQPARTLLYIFLAAAAWRVWRAGRFDAPARGLYALLLLSDLFWPPLLFGLSRPAGLALLGLGWLAALAAAIVFELSDRWAGLLVLPYLLWVGASALLNLAVWPLYP